MKKIKVLRFGEFIVEDILIDKIETPTISRSDYNNKYGQLINSMMEWLRVYKKDITKKITVDFELFLNQTKIDKSLFLDFLKDKRIDFIIELKNDKLIFNNLSSTPNKRYVWEKNIKYFLNLI